MLITFLAKMVHHRCLTGFYIEKDVNGKINSLRTFYTLTNSKKSSESQKKVELGCMTPTGQMDPFDNRKSIDSSKKRY